MKSPIVVSVFYQLLVALPITFILWWYSTVNAYSFALGSLIYIIPNTYFTLYAFRYRGAELARWIARSFSWGESGKLALAAVGFALAFKFANPLNIPILFAGFGSMIVLQWFIARRISNQLEQQAQKEEKN